MRPKDICFLAYQVVSEIEEPFLPLPDDLLVNLHESRDVIDALLDTLPATFQNSTQVPYNTLKLQMVSCTHTLSPLFPLPYLMRNQAPLST